MRAESSYEVAAFKLLDADPTVTAYFEQPVQIHYELAGEVRTHFPDILVVRGNNKELWEVKPKDVAQREDLVERTALMMDELPKYGLPYSMVYGEDLTRKPRFESIDTLLRLGRAAIPVQERERIRVLLEREHCITWGVIQQQYLGKKSVAYASRLMLEGALLWNAEEELTVDSMLTWSKNTHPQLCAASEE